MASASKASGGGDEVVLQQYHQKYHELKRKLADIEKDNRDLHIQVERKRRHVRRLRAERNLLFLKLNEVDGGTNGFADEGDDGNDGLGDDDDDEVASHPVHEDKEYRKKEKVEKDPNAPKKPTNSFVVFCAQSRIKMKESLHTMSPQEQTRFLAEKWKSMTADEKQQYVDIYEKDKARYKKEFASYAATGHFVHETVDLHEASAASSSSQAVKDSQDHQQVQPEIAPAQPAPQAPLPESASSISALLVAAAADAATAQKELDDEAMDTTTSAS